MSADRLPVPIQRVIGKRFGRLTVVGEEVSRRKFVRPPNSWIYYADCVCDCGNRHAVKICSLTMGVTRSCGCLIMDTTTTHGHSYTRVYKAWRSMRDRCTNPRSRSFRNYGGRGITVCGRWLDSFKAFLVDMGSPKDGESLDRIDNNGPYAPGNCRWATSVQQNNNRRGNKRLTFSGKSQTVPQWARELGLAIPTLKSRLRKGWSAHRALTELVS